MAEQEQYGSVGVVDAIPGRRCRFALLAAGLAAASTLVMFTSGALDGSTAPSQLVEGWEGWVKGFVAPYGFAGEEKANPSKGSSGFSLRGSLPRSILNNPKLALNPLKWVKGRIISPALAVPRDFASSCGKERTDPCDTLQTSNREREREVERDRAQILAVCLCAAVCVCVCVCVQRSSGSVVAVAEGFM